MNDVRDILDLGGDVDMGMGESDSRKVGRKRGVVRPKENPPKRPEGMHRELYALLCADGGKNFQELAPILPTDAPGGYKKKIKLGAKKVRQWKWEAFAHPGRKDGPFLCHWRRLGDENKEYPFAKFNSEVGIPQYSQTEYSHLEQEGWTKAETDHLFDLCRRFDLRFFVIQDHWDYKTFGHKSTEEIKDRYYSVCNILGKMRHEQGTPDPKVINYDAEHEKRRKDQLRKLWGRTPEQVEEEEFLRSELKKIEARKKEREKKTQDLQKLITAADAGSAQGGDGTGTPATPSAGGPNLGKKLTTLDQKKSALLAAKKKSGKTPLATRVREGSLSINSPDVFLGIKWPDFKTAGVFVRSQKMKLPSSVGTKKVKAIEQIMNLLGIEIIHTPTEEITSQFNELRSDIVLLYELKSALTSCEMEIHSLAHQYEATTGKKLDIPPIFLNESTSNILRALETPTKNQGISGIQPTTGLPVTPGSISSTLNDLDLVVPHRKRKAALDQANILRKLKAKM